MRSLNEIYPIIFRVFWGAFSIGALVFLGASCTAPLAQQKVGTLLRSDDFGATWTPRSTLALGKGKTTLLAAVEVTRIIPDPRNVDILYVGTKQHGLFGSNNRGETWQQVIPQQTVIDLALDPVARCTLYLVTPSRLLKTNNCAESWDVMLNEGRGGVRLSALALDASSPSTIYIGTTSGDLFRSVDGGVSWSAVYRFAGKNIKKLLSDSRSKYSLFLATKDGFVYESTTQGISWRDISPARGHVDDSMLYRGFEFLSHPDGLLYVSENAMYTTRNRGAQWTALSLLIPSGSARIVVGRVSPLSDEEFYYTTTNTLYHTDTNGKDWVAKPLPTPLVPAALHLEKDRKGSLLFGLRRPVEDSRYFYSADDTEW